jgi:hypothetical protein
VLAEGNGARLIVATRLQGWLVFSHGHGWRLVLLVIVLPGRALGEAASLVRGMGHIIVARSFEFGSNPLPDWVEEAVQVCNSSEFC